MKQTKGTISRSKNYRLRLFILKKKKKEKRLLEEKKKEENNTKKKKDKLFSPNFIPTNKNTKINQNINNQIKILDKKNEKDRKKRNASTILWPLKNDMQNDLNNKKDETIVNQTYQKKTNYNHSQNNKTIKNIVLKDNPNQTENNDKRNEERLVINKKNEQRLLELTITNELEIIFKDQEYELNKLTIEYKVLKKQTMNIVKIKDLEEKEIEINKVLKKIEDIRKQLEVIINSSTFKNIHELKNRYLTNLIDEYRQNLKDNDILLEKVNSIENSTLYLTIFKELKEIKSDEEKLRKELEERKQQYEIRDETFEEWKDNYLDVEKISKSLDDLVKESKKYLKDIEEKVSQAVTVTEIVETKIRNSLGIIGKMLLLTALLKSNPLKKANGIAALEVLLTLNIINEIFKPEKVTKKYFTSDIIDYKNLITNTINDVENVSNLITSSLSTITKLKKTYQKEFSEYQAEIPEYQKLLDQLESIEKEMLERQYNMNKITNELAYQYDKNNQKVKKYQNFS